MDTNVGRIDRIVRILVGLVLVISPLMNMPAIWENSLIAYASMAVGLILAGTAIFGFCPLYRVLGISTCRT